MWTEVFEDHSCERSGHIFRSEEAQGGLRGDILHRSLQRQVWAGLRFNWLRTCALRAGSLTLRAHGSQRAGFVDVFTRAHRSFTVSGKRWCIEFTWGHVMSADSCLMKRSALAVADSPVSTGFIAMPGNVHWVIVHAAVARNAFYRWTQWDIFVEYL